MTGISVMSSDEIIDELSEQVDQLKTVLEDAGTQWHELGEVGFPEKSGKYLFARKGRKAIIVPYLIGEHEDALCEAFEAWADVPVYL